MRTLFSAIDWQSRRAVENMQNNFEKLTIWQESHKLTLSVYKISQNLPKSEIYGIVSQIRRSSSSVPANIAEGYSRKTTKEFLQFLYQAKGSLSETIYFLILIRDLKYISLEDANLLLDHASELSKMLNSFITYQKGLIHDTK